VVGRDSRLTTIKENLKLMEEKEQKDNLEELIESLRPDDKAHEEWMRSMLEKLAPLDPKELADHNAKIEEVKYWREFEGNVFLELLRQYPQNDIDDLLNLTKYVIEVLKR